MSERPILFSGPMVRAILEGRKSQTRRLVKPQPFKGRSDEDVRAEMVKRGALGADESLAALVNASLNAGFIDVQCPYGVPGDQLWVRESWRTRRKHDDLPPRDIPARSPVEYGADDFRGFNGKLRPGIFMPRWACRLVLEVTAVRVERLQSISPADAKAEGIVLSPTELYPDVNTGYKLTRDYRHLWDSLNAKRAPWASNPWVWVVEFKRHGGDGEQGLK